jgi:hypothetical protein
MAAAGDRWRMLDYSVLMTTTPDPTFVGVCDRSTIQCNEYPPSIDY